MKVQTYEEVFGKPLTIKDLVEDFTENTATGQVTAYGGKLNVRPPYQREFIYGDERRNSVVNTTLKGFPLNVMYWAKADDGGFELMDGQQRTISICKYHKDQFTVEVEGATGRNPKTFSNIGRQRQEDFLNYKLTVYICDGTEEEKMEWFQIINVAGLALTKQEMRNAIYNGPWTTSAKRYFSRVDGEGYASEGKVSNGYTYGDYIKVTGGRTSEKEDSVVRQKLLEIVLNWIVDAENVKNREQGKSLTSIGEYMNNHRHEADASGLWKYYESVMEWVKTTFPTYWKGVTDKGIEWGELYNKYKDNTPHDADQKVNDIVNSAKEEIANISKVYEAVLSKKYHILTAREFSEQERRRKWAEQNHTCPYCHKVVDNWRDMHGDHIKPWSKGGKTTYDNLQMLCVECNLKKSAYDIGYTLWDGKDYKGFDLQEWDKKNPAKSKKTV